MIYLTDIVSYNNSEDFTHFLFHDQLNEYNEGLEQSYLQRQEVHKFYDNSNELKSMNSVFRSAEKQRVKQSSWYCYNQNIETTRIYSGRVLIGWLAKTVREPASQDAYLKLQHLCFYVKGVYHFRPEYSALSQNSSMIGPTYSALSQNSAITEPPNSALSQNSPVTEPPIVRCRRIVWSPSPPIVGAILWLYQPPYQFTISACFG